MKAFSLGSLRLLASSGLLFALLGTVIAFTCRDRWPWSALTFYAAPWFLRLGAGCFAWFMLRKSHKTWPIAALLCVLAASAEATRSWGHDKAAPTTNRPDEIVLWNSARCLQKHPDEWPSIANPSTFLVALIETGAFDAPTWQRFCATHPTLQWRRLDGGVSLGTAGTIESVETSAATSAIVCIA